MSEIEQLQKECEKAISLKDFGKAILLYEKLFSLTGDYNNKLCIANIHYRIFKNLPKATAIFREIEPNLSDNINFWWQYHEILRVNNKVFEATECVRKALDLELQTLAGGADA